MSRSSDTEGLVVDHDEPSDTREDPGQSTQTPVVYRVVHQRLALSLVRLALAALGFLGALVAGAGGDAAGVGFALGAGISSLALLTDRRWVLLRRPTASPLPAGARHEPLSRAVAGGLLPSTAGVAVLAAASLAFEPLLAAVLAGILAGMGVVGLAGWAEVVLWERQERLHVFADAAVHTRRYVATPKPEPPQPAVGGSGK